MQDEKIESSVLPAPIRNFKRQVKKRFSQKEKIAEKRKGMATPSMMLICPPTRLGMSIGISVKYPGEWINDGQA